MSILLSCCHLGSFQCLALEFAGAMFGKGKRGSDAAGAMDRWTVSWTIVDRDAAGGDKGKDGKGSGPGGFSRTMGTWGFLKNHRKGLAHQQVKGSRELAAAASAHAAAEAACAQPTRSWRQVEDCWAARLLLTDRQTNMHWLSFKQSSLDIDGRYILNEGNECSATCLTDEEKQFNIQFIADEAAKAEAASAAAVPTQTPALLALEPPPPLAWTNMSEESEEESCSNRCGWNQSHLWKIQQGRLADETYKASSAEATASQSRWTVPENEIGRSWGQIANAKWGQIARALNEGQSWEQTVPPRIQPQPMPSAEGQALLDATPETFPQARLDWLNRPQPPALVPEPDPTGEACTTSLDDPMPPEARKLPYFRDLPLQWNVPQGALSRQQARVGVRKRAASATPSAHTRTTGTASVAIPPRPTREPPQFVLQAHEVRLGDDPLGDSGADWTLHTDPRVEWNLRLKRNELIRKALLEGKTAAYRSSGSSLWPRVHNNDMCVYTPVAGHQSVEVNDVVFCQVPSKANAYFAHIVKEKVPDKKQDGEFDYCISNQRGWINGWCRIENIYGRLSEVLYTPAASAW